MTKTHRKFVFSVNLLCLLAMLNGYLTLVEAQDHAHHDAMTQEEFAELRQKIPLYREMTDEQVIANMQRMGPGVSVYVSPPGVRNPIGVLALGHGYGPDGNTMFRKAYLSTSKQYPTSLGLGMAMMSADFVQTSVDELTAAGAETIIVLPVTTQMTGKLIGQWRYLFGEQQQAPWMSVPRIQTEARVIFGPPPTDDPVISAILLDYVLQNSRDQPKEVVVLIAHGATEFAANRSDLEILSRHVNRIKAQSQFAEVRGFSLQDDAPEEIRQANVNRIREFMRMSAENGQQAIVLTNLPVRGRVQPKIKADLAGLDFVFVENGLVEHPRFKDWIDAVIAASQ